MTKKMLFLASVLISLALFSACGAKAGMDGGTPSGIIDVPDVLQGEEE